MDWIRANGGTISELVGISLAHGQRSIVALGDIPARTQLVSIPPKLQLIPRVAARHHDLPRRAAKVEGTAFGDAAFAAHIVREVERRKELREAGEDGDGGVFFAPFWDSIERHLALVQSPDFWEPHEQEMLGRESSEELRLYSAMYDSTYEAVVENFKQLCANQASPDCSSILGTFDKSNFIRALLMHWSRRFNDGGQGVLPPFVICMNHRLPKDSNVEFDLQQSGVFLATSKWGIAKGEELTITYGNWHNDEMLKVYGFTQPPAIEPSYYFMVYQKHVKADVLPHLEVTDPEGTFGLPTPYLNAEDGELDWAEDLTSLRPLMGGGNFTDLERLIGFYIEDLEALTLLAPFVAELRANRRQNRSSRVWWAGSGDAGDVDKSSSEAVGDARRSDAVRMRMCHFMALTVWQEALLLRKQKLAPEDALPTAKALVPRLDLLLDLSLEDDDAGDVKVDGSDQNEDQDNGDKEPDKDETDREEL